jgi:hypothetical protein
MLLVARNVMHGTSDRTIGGGDAAAQLPVEERLEPCGSDRDFQAPAGHTPADDKGAQESRRLDMSRRIYRSGEIVPTSGQYAVVRSNGSYCGREVTCVRGEQFPPTRGYPEAGFVLRDATIHR